MTRSGLNVTVDLASVIQHAGWIQENPDRAFQLVLDVIEEHGNLSHFDPEGDLRAIQTGSTRFVELIQSTPALRPESV